MTCLLAALLATASTPTDQLLARVPADAAICVVVRDLRGTAARLTHSPFARWLEKSKLLEPLAADRKKLTEVEQFLADKLGSTPQQLLDDVFGDAVVLAYRPGPPGKPEQESGVIMLHARDPARLATVLDRLNALQTESGELKSVTQKDEAGGTAYTRTRADGGREFLHRRGSLLAFSAQESAVAAVVAGTGGSPAAASLRKLGAADAPVAVWFHPPSLLKDVPPRVAEVWSACDGLVLTARATAGLEVEAALSVDPAKLPPAVRALLYPAAGPTAWGAVPDTALAAVGGRLDLPGLVAAADTFLPGTGTATDGLTDALAPLLGRANVPAVLAGVGPEWVAWADAPAAGWLPDWTAAVRVSPAAAKPLRPALDLAAGLVRLAYNRDHTDPLDLGEDTRDGRTVKYLSGPLAQRPAYGFVGGFLVLASSPERVHGFRPGSATAPPLARLDAGRLRAFLTSRREAVAAGLAAQDGRAAADVAKELEGLANLLEAFRRVELRHAAEGGVIRLTLAVETVEPLR